MPGWYPGNSLRDHDDTREASHPLPNRVSTGLFRVWLLSGKSIQTSFAISLRRLRVGTTRPAKASLTYTEFSESWANRSFATDSKTSVR